MIENLTIDANSKDLKENVLEMLNKHGVLVIKDYLNAEDLKTINEEYDKIFELNESYLKELPYPQGKAKSIDFEKINDKQLPITKKVFSSNFMKEITDAYLGVPNFLNHEIYVANDVQAEHNALNELHYDRLTTLKFFLYLNDIDRTNGAFECVPGSHRLAQRIMNYYKKRGKRLMNFPNRTLPDSLEKAIPMEAPAGSMIIFTTDAYHRAGTLEAGKERKIMRGHCRSNPMPKYAPPVFSKQWMRESIFNPARYYYGISDLITGAKPY